MPTPAPPKTYASLTSAFTAFLTVAIHTIIAERNIYPTESFLTARAYNFPVRQSRHPLVCQWINDAVAAVEKEILKGTIAKIAVVIFDTGEGILNSDENNTHYANGGVRPLERFVIDMKNWPVIPTIEVDTEFASPNAQGTTAQEEDPDIDEQLRAVLAKLAVCSNSLKPIPDGCTFTICIELKGEMDPPIGHPQPWIPSEPGTQRILLTRGNEEFGGDIKTATKNGEELGGGKTVPIRAVGASELMFEVWVEEGKAKNENACMSKE